MFRPPDLHTAENVRAFNRALRASRRTLMFRVRLFNKVDEPLAIPIKLLDGEVVVDCTDPDAPTRTAHIVVLDPKQRLAVNARHPADGALWFSKRIGLWWCIWVAELNKWVDVPVFYGSFELVSHRGAELELDCHGKDKQHLDPYLNPTTFSIRKNTRVHRAIRQLLSHRGETRFDLNETRRRLRNGRSYPRGAQSWRLAQSLAADVDRHLYYRGNGQLRMRRLPDKPVWKFSNKDLVVGPTGDTASLEGVVDTVIVKNRPVVRKMITTPTELDAKANSGDTNVTVKSNKDFSPSKRITIGRGDRKETRTVTSVAGNIIHFTGRALTRSHAKGTRVEVRHRVERRKSVAGVAKLPHTHDLSAGALTDGKRPRVQIETRDGIRSNKAARERAEAILKRIKPGVASTIDFSAITVPHLEEKDLVLLRAYGKTTRVRLERFTIPLSIEGTQAINWTGERVPERRHGKKKKGAR